MDADTEPVDLDLGLPGGGTCSRLWACEGMPVVPPPIGPARALSKVMGDIPNEWQVEFREDEGTM